MGLCTMEPYHEKYTISQSRGRKEWLKKPCEYESFIKAWRIASLLRSFTVTSQKVGIINVVFIYFKTDFITFW